MQSIRVFLGVLVLVCSSLVVSQTLDQEVALLPNCSITCITSFASAAGCGPTDYTCQCSNQQEIVGGLAIGNTASSCIIDACGIKNATATWATFANVCNIVQGLPLSSSSASVSSAVTSISSAVASISSAVASASVAVTSVSAVVTSVKQSTALGISSSSGFVTTTQSSRSTFTTQTSQTPGLLTTASTSVSLLPSLSTSESTSPTSPTYAGSGISSVTISDSGSLSYGARAGIAIGISIFSLLLVCLVMYVLRQCQRQTRPSGFGTFTRTNFWTSILPVQTSPAQGDIGNIKILRHVSITSSRLDNPENRPTVPTKDGESEKEREFVADTETPRHLSYLPSIRESLESVRVHGNFEIGTKVNLRPNLSPNEDGLESPSQAPRIRDLEPQSPFFAPEARDLDPFGDIYTLPPSPSSIRTSQLPQTPSSFETTEQGDGSSRGSNRSTLSLFPPPPRSSISLSRPGSRKSDGSALNDSMSGIGVRFERLSRPRFQSDSTSIISQGYVLSEDQGKSESEKEDDVPPLPTMNLPLGQNPFQPGDANFEAARKYFSRENSIKR